MGWVVLNCIVLCIKFHMPISPTIKRVLHKNVLVSFPYARLRGQAYPVFFTLWRCCVCGKCDYTLITVYSLAHFKCLSEQKYVHLTTFCMHLISFGHRFLHKLYSKFFSRQTDRNLPKHENQHLAASPDCRLWHWRTQYCYSWASVPYLRCIILRLITWTEISCAINFKFELSWVKFEFEIE